MSGMPTHLLRDVDALLRRIDGRRVVASISGGKDSAAMSLYLTELGIEHNRVFADTGWESDLTYEYLRGDLPAKIGPIDWVRGDHQMIERILRHGMFPARHRRWCTKDLKTVPLTRYITRLMDVGDDVVNAVGIRAEESDKRAEYPEWEWMPEYDCDMWRPMMSWTEQDVIDIHTRHGLRPNPLYLKGATRVGCWPCIFSRKAELRLLADEDPARIAVIRDLEQKVTKITREKIEARGETFGLNGTQKCVAFFWGVGPTGGKKRGYVPIDNVVKWSRTKRGGRQIELFAPPENERGCMRWGLCETHGGDDE